MNPPNVLYATIFVKNIEKKPISYIEKMLNIIYFLDPWIKPHKEQKHTLKGHLSFFAYEVQKDSNVHLFVIAHQELEAYALEEQIPVKILPLKIRGDETEFEKINKVRVLVKKSPDLIIAYETHAQWLNECFDKTVVVNEQWGALSRPPFPALTFFDYNGTYQNSILFKNAKKIKAKKLSSNEEKILNSIRKIIVCSLVQTDPLKTYAKIIRKQYKKLVLIPLQIDDHISFNGCCHWENHKLMLHDILNIIDKDIGVIVTQHPDSKRKVINVEEICNFEKLYPNFIYFSDTENIPMLSQWWLLYVDGLLTVSSGVAYQAALLNIPVVALGKSNINVVSSTSLSDFSKHIKYNIKNSYIDGAIWEVIHTYNFFLDDYRFDIVKLKELWYEMIGHNLFIEKSIDETLNNFKLYFRHSILQDILLERDILTNDGDVLFESQFIYDLVIKYNNPVLSYYYNIVNHDDYNSNIVEILPKNNVVMFFFLLIKEYFKRKFMR